MWTRESCIEAVRAFVMKHGYQPVSREAQAAHGLPSFGVAVKLFGSWNALIEAAGYRPYPSRASVHGKAMAWRDRHRAAAE